MVFIRQIQSTDWQGLYDLINHVDKTLVGMYTSTKEIVEDWINTIDVGIWEVYVAILPLEEVQKIRKQFRKLIEIEYCACRQRHNLQQSQRDWE